MILEEKYRKKYKKLMEDTRNRGLQKKLMEESGVKQQPCMSNILDGTRHVNSTSLELIKNYLDNYKTPKNRGCYRL